MNLELQAELAGVRVICAVDYAAEMHLAEIREEVRRWRISYTRKRLAIARDANAAIAQARIDCHAGATTATVKIP